MFNKAIFVGRLGQDPKEHVKSTDPNDTFATFSLAVSKKVKNSNGDYEEYTNWIPVICFDNQANFVINYAAKGDLILVEGELRCQKTVIQDNSGNDVYYDKINIYARNVTMLSSKSEKEARKAILDNYPSATESKEYSMNTLPEESYSVAKTGSSTKKKTAQVIEDIDDELPF